MRDISRNVFFYLTFMAHFFGAAPSNLLDDLLHAIGIAESSPKHIDALTHTHTRARDTYTRSICFFCFLRFRVALVFAVRISN